MSQQVENASTRSLWQEPILHFIAIGILIFTLDILANDRSSEKNVIVIGQKLKNELARQFQDSNKRKPTDKELQNMQELWLQTELLYRNGLSLGLDKNDPAIRQRVIQKSEFLLKNLTNTKEPSDTELKQWYTTHVNDYRKPPLYDFEHIFFRKSITTAHQKAQQVLDKIINGIDPQTNYESNYHKFVARNPFGLKVSFGQEFVSALDQSLTKKWQLLKSNKGWHVVRVQAKREQPAPPFRKMRQTLLADWYKKQQREAVNKLITDLRDKYTIKYES